MNVMDIIQSMGFLLPMVSALVCCILLVAYYRSVDIPAWRKPVILMICTYIVIFLIWFGITLYVVSYHGFVWFNTLFFLFLMLDQVLLYHFIWSITGTGETDRFHPVHYIIPVILALVMGIWSLLVPYDVQYFIVENRGNIAEGYFWYSLFFSVTVPVFIFYNIFYPLLGLRRIRIYRRAIVDYSADESRTSAKWLFQLIFLIWFTLPLPLATLFWHKNIIFNSVFTIIGAFLPIVQYLMICYNLITGNYVIIPLSKDEKALNRGEKPVNRKQFEQYINSKKPYLNPYLKITDLTIDLNTNRSYISAFINKEYHMNFSRYINIKRLEELDRLRRAQAGKVYDGRKLIWMAGFSSFRSYLRVRKEEDGR